MVAWVFCAGLVLLHICCSVEAKLHHVVIFPSELRSQHFESFCIQLVGAQGESKVQISLSKDEKNTMLIDKSFQQDSIFTCIPALIPNPTQGEDEVAKLEVAIQTGEESIKKSTKVIVKKEKNKILIQTDKAVYKPGQTVKFRIISLNEDLQPGQHWIPSVQLQDSGNNRIGQWLNVTLRNGLAEFSFTLLSDPPLGEYSIRVKDTIHYFAVKEYVLPKYEVILQFPKAIPFQSEHFPVKLCGRYTYGKPVCGDYVIEICRRQERYQYWYFPEEPLNSLDICANYTGKLDHDNSGCSTIQVKSEVFKLTRSDMELSLEGTAYITEDGTGIELSTGSQTKITNVIDQLQFVDYESAYKSGIPYRGMLRATDTFDDPLVGQTVYLKVSNGDFTSNQILVTNENGQVSFTIENTTNWQGQVRMTAKTYLLKPKYVPGFISAYYGYATLYLNSASSRSKSFLKIHSVDVVLPCEGQHEVKVEYIIKHSELENKDKTLGLQFLVTSKGSIQQSGLISIPISRGNKEVRGETAVKLSLRPGTSPSLHVFAYILLPYGDIVGDLAVFKVQRCFNNKVSVGFSTDEVLPGSDVSLQVQSAPGSLCGLRVVDKSVVLMKPEAEMTDEMIYNLFPYQDSNEYDYRIRETENCYYSHHNFIRDKRDLHPYFYRQSVYVFSLLKKMKLKIFTNASICKDPDLDLLVGSAEDMDSPKENPRIYFPETWIWQLVTTGDNGRVELHHKAPDTITEWNGRALCMGTSGFGLSSSTSLRVFQPFFVDLALPYSVVKGETFTLKAIVFNYLKQCIKVQTTLLPSLELNQEQCVDCQYSSCLCADESKTFYWKLKASKLGKVNITVRTEAVNSAELCQNEIPIVPKKGNSDTIIKPLLVQPGGIMQEKSYSSLLCCQDGSKSENVLLQIPENILKESERAYVTVLGDLMGTALENLDRLLAMPFGCGEQNMVLFAPNIFILQYLEKTYQLTDEIKSKAITFLKNGYQRELTYKHKDGSYSAFGNKDREGNTWLTAFVVKSFSKARPYIFIDEGYLNESFTWLRTHQNKSGCFRSVGKLFNNVMKGGVEDDVSLSAYVTISLLESGVSVKDPLVKHAVSCLKEAAVSVSNTYTLALLAYTFTLCGEVKLRKTLFDKLEEKAVRGEGQLHWERKSTPYSDVPYWYRASSAEVEMTSYILLALLYGPEPNLGKATEIVNWVTKQQNPFGGFSSTQDTVVALQALAKYAEATYSDKGNIIVTVTSKAGYLEQFHVDNSNRLLLQRAALPTIPGDYTVTATGTGCVYAQTVLRYNIPTVRNEATFAISVEVTPKKCMQDPVKILELLISSQFTGGRERSNMAIIEVKMLSGYIPVKGSVRKLENKQGIQRSEISKDMVTLYLNELGHDPVQLNIQIEQDIEVKDLKPATVRVYDYYETDEEAFAEYNSPCSSDTTGNAT